MYALHKLYTVFVVVLRDSLRYTAVRFTLYIFFQFNRRSVFYYYDMIKKNQPKALRRRIDVIFPPDVYVMIIFYNTIQPECIPTRMNTNIILYVACCIIPKYGLVYYRCVYSNWKFLLFANTSYQPPLSGPFTT